MNHLTHLGVLAGTLMLSATGAFAGPSHFRNRQISTVPIFTGMGDPLPGVANNLTDLTNFSNGQLNMQEFETLNPATDPTGPAGQLGPLFNNTSCATCHDHPATGGGGLTLPEQRLSTGGPPVRIFAVDHMLFGGPEEQDGLGTIFPYGIVASPLGAEIGVPDNIASACQQVELARGFSPELPICVPGSPNDTGLTGTPTCIAHREALPLFGDGLVEAVPDQEFLAIQAAQPAAMRGTIHHIVELNQLGVPTGEVSAPTLAALSTTRVGRFGWKDDHATLLGFAGDAYLNEIGITNDLNSQPNTTCAMGVQQFGITLQTADDPEDTVDSTGRADVDRFTDFMRGLQPPPQIPMTASAQAGQQLFHQMNCSVCHVPTLVTANNPVGFIPPTINGTPISAHLNQVLAGVTFNPYGDFLLHDMGSLGDGINDSPEAGPTMMRTMPLWGIRAREVFLHDGRATDIPTAISLHAGQAAPAAAAFGALTPAQQQSVVDFLNTL